MTDMLTREELLRRAGFGAAMLSIPGLAAACGGSSGGSDASGSTQKLASDAPVRELAALHGLRREDEALPDPRNVHEEDWASRSTTPRTSTRTPSTSGRSRARSPGASRSTRTSSSSPTTSATWRLMIDKGWVEELDKDAIPNIINLANVQQHPGFDPDRKYSLPWQSGMTGIAYNPKLTKPILSIDQLLEDKSLKGQITVLQQFRGHARARDALERRRPEQGHGRLLESRDRPDQGRVGHGPDPPVHRERIRRAAGARATSRRASPGPATSCSSCRTIPA